MFCHGSKILMNDIVCPSFFGVFFRGFIDCRGEKKELKLQLKPGTPLVHVQAWLGMLQSRCPKIVSPPQVQLGEMMVR